MHALMFVVLAGWYFSTAFYPDAERTIWMRTKTVKFQKDFGLCMLSTK